MRVSRQFSVAVQYVLDEWIPPRLRDSRALMYPPMRMMFRDKTPIFMGFKRRAFGMSEAEFSAVYRNIEHVSQIQGETDLNRACTQRILESVEGTTVLDAGCGRGFLVDKLSALNLQTTGVDIVVSEKMRKRFPAAQFHEASAERLPFDDNSFDTVISTHTLEHVQNLPQALSELRRVAAKRLIIVVPRQRPYKYNFSLHIHFFPYEWSLVGQFGYRPGVVIERLGDWYYQEDAPTVGGV